MVSSYLEPTWTTPLIRRDTGPWRRRRRRGALERRWYRVRVSVLLGTGEGGAPDVAAERCTGLLTRALGRRGRVRAATRCGQDRKRAG